MCSISKIEKNSNHIDIYIHACHLSIVNSLRRTILNDIKTPAIDYVKITKNSGIIHDDLLQERFQLLPIRVNADVDDSQYNESSLVGSFQARGDTDYSFEIIWSNDCIKMADFTTVYNCEMNHLIGKDMEITGEIFVRNGYGREHAKFCPVCNIYFTGSKEDQEFGDWVLSYDTIGQYEADDILLQALVLLNDKFMYMKGLFSKIQYSDTTNNSMAL